MAHYFDHHYFDATYFDVDSGVVATGPQSWANLTVRFGAQDLSQYVSGVGTLHAHAGLIDWIDVGARFPSPKDEGTRSMDPVTLSFLYNSALVPVLPIGVSDTLTIGLGTGLDVDGTFVLSEYQLSTGDGSHKLDVTLTPSGTINWNVGA